MPLLLQKTSDSKRFEMGALHTRFTPIRDGVTLELEAIHTRPPVFTLLMRQFPPLWTVSKISTSKLEKDTTDGLTFRNLGGLNGRLGRHPQRGPGYLDQPRHRHDQQPTTRSAVQ